MKKDVILFEKIVELVTFISVEICYECYIRVIEVGKCRKVRLLHFPKSVFFSYVHDEILFSHHLSFN